MTTHNVVRLGRRAQPLSGSRPPSLESWHVELLCALDTIGLAGAETPTYDAFKPGGPLDSRLEHLCALCCVSLAEDTPAPSRMHLWLRLTKTYVNAIRAFVAQPDTYESHYRPRLSSQEHHFIEALSLRQPSRGMLFQALLPLAVREDLVSQTARVLTWKQVERLATAPGSPPESS